MTTSFSLRILHNFIHTDLSANSEGWYTICPLNFDKIKDTVSDSKCRCSQWFAGWVWNMKIQSINSGLYLQVNIDQFRFKDAYAGRKNPNTSMFPMPTRPWPTIALEMGYSETHDALMNDADLLLEGTRGNIALAINVKIEPLGPDSKQTQKGYVELHKFDAGTRKRERIGERQVTFPVIFPLSLVSNMFSVSIPAAVRSFQAMYQV